MQFMTWERQRAYDLDAGREEGIAEGIKQGTLVGARQNAIEAAKKLLKMNVLTVEQIAEAQGLPIEQVKVLAEEIRKE